MRSWKVVFTILIILLSVVHAVIFVKSIHISEEISKLEARTRAVRQKNTDLEALVYNKSSFQQVSSEAAKLGFTKAGNTLNLKLAGVAHKE